MYITGVEGNIMLELELLDSPIISQQYFVLLCNEDTQYSVTAFLKSVTETIDGLSEAIKKSTIENYI